MRIWGRLVDEPVADVVETTVRNHVRERRPERGYAAGDVFVPQVNAALPTGPIRYGRRRACRRRSQRIFSSCTRTSPGGRARWHRRSRRSKRFLKVTSSRSRTVSQPVDRVGLGGRRPRSTSGGIERHQSARWGHLKPSRWGRAKPSLSASRSTAGSCGATAGGYGYPSSGTSRNWRRSFSSTAELATRSWIATDTTVDGQPF
jgi:hypothetical protein